MRILPIMFLALILIGSMFSGDVFASASSEENVAESSFRRVSHVKSGNAYVPKGTLLEVEVTRTFSSRNFNKGDQPPLRLAENLIVNDVIVVPRGTRVKGEVTKARRAGGFGTGGKLEFQIISVKAINGVEIPLTQEIKRKGGRDDGAIAVGAVVSLVGGAFMKGKNSTIPIGTRFSVEVTEDTDLETPLDKLSEVMDVHNPNGVRVNIK